MTAEVFQLCGQVFADPSLGEGNTAVLRVVIRPAARVLPYCVRVAKEFDPSPSLPELFCRVKCGGCLHASLFKGRNSLVLYIAGIKQRAGI